MLKVARRFEGEGGRKEPEGGGSYQARTMLILAKVRVLSSAEIN